MEEGREVDDDFDGSEKGVEESGGHGKVPRAAPTSSRPDEGLCDTTLTGTACHADGGPRLTREIDTLRLCYSNVQCSNW